MGPPITWSLKILTVLALLYTDLVAVRDELGRRSRQSTAAYCGIGERRTLCSEKPAFLHFCKYVATHQLCETSATQYSAACHQYRTWCQQSFTAVIPSPTFSFSFSCPPGAAAHPVNERGGDDVTTTTTTTLSPEAQAEEEQLA